MERAPTSMCRSKRHTMPAHPRAQQKGGLSPFAQQLAMFSLAPIVTDLASNVIGGLLPGLGGGQRGSGQFILPGNSQMIGLPNHLPPFTYLGMPPPRRQKGRGLVRKRKKARRPLQKGGIGPLALAGMALAPMLLQPLLGRLQGR